MLFKKEKLDKQKNTKNEGNKKVSSDMTIKSVNLKI